jgi:hypothetical protein
VVSTIMGKSVLVRALRVMHGFATQLNRSSAF